MKTVMVILASLLFSSCMHLGMTGMAGHDDGVGTERQTTLEKELTVGNVRVNAFFPVMEKGKETVFTLKLTDASTLQALEGAEVYGHVDYRAPRASHEMMQRTMMKGQRDTTEEMDGMHMMQHPVDSSVQSDGHNAMMIEQTEHDHDTLEHREALEGKERGMYTFTATVRDEGEYTVVFHIVSIGGQKLTPEILVEAKRNVSDAPMHGQGGMMGMGGSSAYVIVGAVLMGTMMALVWLVHGGMNW